MKNIISQVASSISEDFKAFEIEMKKIIEQYDNFLKDDLCCFVFENAKFIRPIMVFIFADILDIKNDNVLKIALALEFIHNASLIHDDIIDEAQERRNAPALHQKFSQKNAVLAGDLLLASVLKILSTTNSDITGVFSNRIFNTIQGELKQNENLNKQIDFETYLYKTFNKTANLFFAGFESLILLKESNKELEHKLREYLTNFCYAFQIKNDIKDVDSDYKNGNYTLPLIYYFRENKIYDKNKLDKYISKSTDIVNEYKKKALASIIDINDEKIIPLRKLIEII